jgi:hypothetical protein
VPKDAYVEPQKVANEGEAHHRISRKRHYTRV